MRMTLRSLSCLVAMTISAAAIGQEPCELHFWGSSIALTSNYSGVPGLAGALLAGPRPQTGEALSSDLPIEAQVEALNGIDLAQLLKMPGVVVIPEQGRVAGKEARQTTRLTKSTAPCYAELTVDYVGYTSHITAGRKFGARFYLRRFAGPDTPADTHNGGKDVKLRIYPAKKPEDHAAALLELKAAFGQAAKGFLLNKVNKSQDRPAPPRFR